MLLVHSIFCVYGKHNLQNDALHKHYFGQKSNLLMFPSDVHEAEKSRTRPRPRQKCRGKDEARQKQKFSRQGEDEAEAANSRPRQGSKIKSSDFCYLFESGQKVLIGGSGGGGSLVGRGGGVRGWMTVDKRRGWLLNKSTKLKLWMWMIIDLYIPTVGKYNVEHKNVQQS